MLQRIQTVYLLLAIICLSIVTFGMTIFNFSTEENYYIFSSYGLQEFDKSNVSVSMSSYPYYLTTIALILLKVMCIFSYKNIKRQMSLGRMIFFIYFLLVVALVVFSFFGSSVTGTEETVRGLGIGFFLFVAGLPFIFLANVGIKRDKNLLDSLNRLR